MRQGVLTPSLNLLHCFGSFAVKRERGEGGERERERGREGGRERRRVRERERERESERERE